MIKLLQKAHSALDVTGCITFFNLSSTDRSQKERKQTCPPSPKSLPAVCPSGQWSIWYSCDLYRRFQVNCFVAKPMKLSHNQYKSINNLQWNMWWVTGFPCFCLHCSNGWLSLTWMLIFSQDAFEFCVIALKISSNFSLNLLSPPLSDFFLIGMWN